MTRQIPEFRLLKQLPGRAGRLVRDPRWQVFLRETTAGLERPRKLSRALARQVEARAPTVRRRDAVIMQRYVGTCAGSLISSGTSSVITKLFPSGSGGLQGRYLSEFARMEPRFWDEMTLWNGKLQ
jgi:hypothetical protein